MVINYNSRLLARLNDAELDLLEPFLESVESSAGEVLLDAGAMPNHVWFPETCVAGVIVATPAGRAVEVAKIGFEGMTGVPLLLGGERGNMTISVQIGGAARRMRSADFLSQVVEPRNRIYAAFLRYADAFCEGIAQLAACNSLHSIDERLARWILATQDRSPSRVMPLTQEFIASMLGIRRASVSTAASTLAQAGAIKYTRGELEVTDRVVLEQHSCACYRVLREIAD